jgi:hypothetical protein
MYTQTALGQFEHIALVAIIQLGEDVPGVPILKEIRPFPAQRDLVPNGVAGGSAEV